MMEKRVEDVAKVCIHEFLELFYYNSVVYSQNLEPTNEFYEKMDLKFNFQECISAYLKEMNICDLILYDSDNIGKLYDYIIKNEIEKLKVLLGKFCYSEIVIGIYNLSEYIAMIHSIIYGIKQGNINLGERNFLNKTEKNLLEYIKSQSDKFYIFSGLMGFDKNIIQYIFSVLRFIPKNNHKGYILSSSDFKKIYFKCSNILTLISQRDILKVYIKQLEKVNIKNYQIILPKKVEYLFENVNKNSYFDSEVFDNRVPQKLLEKLDANLNDEYNFSIKTLEKLINSKGSKIMSTANFVNLFDRDSFVRDVMKYTFVSKDEATSLMKYLIVNNEVLDEGKLEKSIDLYNKRIFGNPLFEIDFNGINVYVVSHSLIIYSYQALIEKLIYNELELCKKKNSLILEKFWTEKLVENIGDVIDKKNLIAERSFEKIEINYNGKKEKVSFDEIDNVFIYKEVLYLVECKNISYKFDSSGFNKDISRAKKYIRKLDEKAKFFEKNKEKFESYFCTTFSKIEKILVYKRYNITIDSFIDKIDTKIFTEQAFIKWLDNLIK